eukprot:COSAG01_NODE_3675_length_5804_cov_4.926919_9_plen_215_part_00
MTEPGPSAACRLRQEGEHDRHAAIGGDAGADCTPAAAPVAAAAAAAPAAHEHHHSPAHAAITPQMATEAFLSFVSLCAEVPEVFSTDGLVETLGAELAAVERRGLALEPHLRACGERSSHRQGREGEGSESVHAHTPSGLLASATRVIAGNAGRGVPAIRGRAARLALQLSSSADAAAAGAGGDEPAGSLSRPRWRRPATDVHATHWSDRAHHG